MGIGPEADFAVIQGRFVACGDEGQCVGAFSQHGPSSGEFHTALGSQRPAQACFGCQLDAQRRGGVLVAFKATDDGGGGEEGDERTQQGESPEGHAFEFGLGLEAACFASYVKLWGTWQQRVDGFNELFHGGEALAGLMLEASADDGIQAFVEGGFLFGGEGAYSARGRVSDEDFIEEDTEREDIGAMVCAARIRLLLWRHIGSRTHGHIGLSQVGIDGRDVAVFCQACEAEIHHFWDIAGQLVDEDVFRFQVPVNDAARMRISDGLADEGEEFEGGHGLKVGLAQHFAQRRPFNIFHDDIINLFLGMLRGASVQDGDDIGVGEGGHSSGLALEACDGACVFGQLGREQFNGDRPMKGALSCLMDFSHTSSSEQIFQVIPWNTVLGLRMGEGSGGQQFHCVLRGCSKNSEMQ